MRRRRKSFYARILAIFLLIQLSAAIPAKAQTLAFQRQPSIEVRADFNQLLQILEEIIRTSYVGEVPDIKNIRYGAAKGLIRSLGDQHSAFLTPAETKQFDDIMRGSFGGIGAELRLQDEIVTVVGVHPGSPADKAGVRKGDRVWKIDGKTLENLSILEVVMRVRGPEGTAVTLTIVHENAQEAADYTLVRETIPLNLDVSVKFVGNAAIITVPEFGANTLAQFLDAVRAAKNQLNLAGVIIDLRNNGGGLLNACGGMLGVWMQPAQPYVRLKSKTEEAGLSALELGNAGQSEISQALSRITKESLSLAGVPTAILVNSMSASASEIFSGAAQDYGFAKVIGEKTYGKGSAQDVITFSDGSSLHITTMWWVTPKDRVIEKNGIEPDIAVEAAPEDFVQGQDPQLERALEFLKTGM